VEVDGGEFGLIIMEVGDECKERQSVSLKLEKGLAEVRARIVQLCNDLFEIHKR
jgi:hypothetical protein